MFQKTLHTIVLLTVKRLLQRRFGRTDCLRLWVVVILFSSLCQYSHAQETQYTLFQNNPIYLNPANTGNFIGDWRLGANYRNQWRSIADPFQTASVSYDQQIFLLNQDIGGGVYVLSDYTGPNGLSFTKVYASLAYGKNIKMNYVRAGLQIGYVFGNLGSSRTSPSQWDPSTGFFNSDLPASSVLDDKIQYLDINFGANWKRSIGIFEPSAGIAVHHLNRPSISFYSSNAPLTLRWNINADAKAKLSDTYFVTPRVLYSKQGKGSLTIAGIEAGTNLFGNRSVVKELRAGVHVRNGISDKIDAVSVIAGAHINRVDVSIAYDVNVSGLSNYSGNRGAFEFSIVYRSISTILNSYSIPCDRL